jgi:hypothetical protein
MRRWLAVLLALAAVRVAIPLAALAASGSKLPGLPRWRWDGLTGDATGFYAGARQFVSACARPLFVVALLVGLYVAVTAWRRLRGTPWLVPALAFVASLVVCVGIAGMDPSGAAVFGWPLLWSLPMLPLRAVGALNPTVAFGVGLPFQLLANAVTVVATGFAGRNASGRRSVGTLAAAVFALWPFLSGAIAGHRAWENGQWAVDAGLHLYTEPVSTALVAVALALVLSRVLTPTRLAVAGTCLSYATFVKLSNGITAAVVLALLLWRLRPDRRRVAPYLAGGLSFAPAVAAYWPLSYPKLFDNPNSYPRHAWSLHWAAHNWGHDALVFRPHVVAIVVPLAAIGLALLRWRWAAVVLACFVLVNVGVYSFYRVLWEHPRFLHASLPAFFVLWAAGADGVVRLVARAVRLPRPAVP